MFNFLLPIALFATPQDSLKTPRIDSVAQVVRKESDILKGRFARIDLQNDAWLPRFSTDRYFTGGIQLEYLQTKPSFKKIDRLFPQASKGRKKQNMYGFLFNTQIYTPENIHTTEIQKEDRPYAALMTVGLKHISTDPDAATKLHTEYVFGVIGPAAQGEFIQNNFHDIINRPHAEGWQNQLRNDVVLNMNIVAEKGFNIKLSHIEAMGVFEANVGTLMSYAGVGGMIRAGFLNNYFANTLPLSTGERKFQNYIFVRPMVRFVADNALLEGGMFSFRECPYIVRRDRINRFYINSSFGATINYKHISFTYAQYFRSPEFDGAKNMYWGNFVIMYGLWNKKNTKK